MAFTIPPQAPAVQLPWAVCYGAAECVGAQKDTSPIMVMATSLALAYKVQR